MESGSRARSGRTNSGPEMELRPGVSGKCLRELPDLLSALTHLSEEDLDGMEAGREIRSSLPMLDQPSPVPHA